MTDLDQSTLRNNCLLAAELTDAQCAILMQSITTRRLVDGEMLIREGTQDNCLHVIAEGMLAVTKLTGAGETVTLHILEPGDVAGALGFIDGEDHSASLQAVGPAMVFCLERSRLEALIPVDAGLVYQVMRALVRAVHRILRRMNVQHVELTRYIADHQQH